MTKDVVTYRKDLAQLIETTITPSPNVVDGEKKYIRVCHESTLLCKSNKVLESTWIKHHGVRLYCGGHGYLRDKEKTASVLVFQNVS